MSLVGIGLFNLQVNNLSVIQRHTAGSEATIPIPDPSVVPFGSGTHVHPFRSGTHIHPFWTLTGSTFPSELEDVLAPSCVV
jgi:hypothetical protein